MLIPLLEIDLAAIARSSVAVSGSPPKDNAIASSIFVSLEPFYSAPLQTVTRHNLTFAPAL
jgi:hypothetical protein